jgi:integrase
MARRTYRFVARPVATPHQHPHLVFDGKDRLHFHLTVFAKEAVAQLSEGTVRTYLYAILPFFTFLDTDPWQQRAGSRWDTSPDEVRQAVDNYLVQHLRCKVRQHRQGFQLVSITRGTRSTIHVFLSGLKGFYRVMKQHGYYAFANPLVDPVSALHAMIEEEPESLSEYPHMPDCSGMELPRYKTRLSDSYFKLEGEEWIPQVVDDPALPGRVLAGGQRINWGLREECITRILFESGGRVSEVVGISLGDWVARGMLQEANTFSKGSHGTRIKFLRFSNDTGKLLRRYFDEERRKSDLNGCTLADYVELSKRHQIDLSTVPLFLSGRGTPLCAKTFRENFWNPACRMAQVDVDIHQCRHWYVTAAVRHIYETAKAEGEVKRRLRELIEYMKWRRGWQTIECYEHYFDVTRHAEIQNAVHQKLDESLKQGLAERRTSTPRGHKVDSASATQPLTHLLESDPDFDFLCSMGGHTHAS